MNGQKALLPSSYCHSDWQPRRSFPANERETLESCTLLACEDTRVTGRLLAHLSLSIQMVSYREENERTKTGELIDAIEQGAQVGLVSDAGFPGISDPGLRLVRECHARSIRVIPIPGPNAAITALAASGLPTHQFTFLGFYQRKASRSGNCSNNGRIAKALWCFTNQSTKLRKL